MRLLVYGAVFVDIANYDFHSARASIRRYLCCASFEFSKWFLVASKPVGSAAKALGLACGPQRVFLARTHGCRQQFVTVYSCL